MTTVGWGKPEHPVADAVGAVVAALDGAADVPLWSLSDEEVEGLLRSAHGARARVDALALRLVSEVARRRTGERSGATSTRAWLRSELQVSPGEAKRDVELAAALAGPLELTRVALAAGDISRAHAQVVAKVMGSLPDHLGSEVRARAERQLLDWCRQFDSLDVAGLGRRLWEVVDPEGVDAEEAKALERQEREASRKRHLAIGPDGFGRFRLWGQLDPGSAAIVKAALDPLAKPLPSTADGPDPRTPGQRNADAPSSSCVAASSPRGRYRSKVVRSRRSWSRWTWPSSAKESAAASSTPGTLCHRRRCGSWPVTPRSSQPSWAPTGSHST
jgi:hypothetical protein